MMKLTFVVSIETAMWCQVCSETEAVVSTLVLEVNGELKASLPVDLVSLRAA